MNRLRYRYYRFIEKLDPYENIREHYRLSCNQMLYNLIEIQKDWELQEHIELSQLINDFKSAGYREDQALLKKIFCSRIRGNKDISINDANIEHWEID